MLWLLGYPDQAVKQARESIVLAETLAHMPSVCHALWFAATASSSAAVAISDALDETFWQAGILCVQGDLIRARSAGDWRAAQDRYSEAVAIAREQRAKSLELRAATSLARLWGEQGRQAEAHDLLAPVYGWFTEGFDTADLKDARALLDELA